MLGRAQILRLLIAVMYDDDLDVAEHSCLSQRQMLTMIQHSCAVRNSAAMAAVVGGFLQSSHAYRVPRLVAHLQEDRIDIATVLQKTQPALWTGYIRMNRDAFFRLASMLRGDPLFRHTCGRKQATVEAQFFIAIWRLARGASVPSTQFTFAISAASVCYYTLRVCEALMRIAQLVVKTPQTHAELSAAAKDFEEVYPEFPGCIGILDGTHIPIIAPREWPTEYWCFKKFYSLNSLCAVDGRLRFIFFRSGYPGVRQDTHNYEDSELYTSLRGPMASAHVYLLGDTGFPCTTTLITGYKNGQQGGGSAERRDLFNSNVAKVRGLVERAFGILKAQWRILTSTLRTASVDAAVAIINGCLVLHNWCRNNQPGYADIVAEVGATQQQIPAVPTYHGGGTPDTAAAELMRMLLIDHMVNMQEV